MKGKKFGAPPKKGPNSQVPPIKLFQGGPSGKDTFKEQTDGRMFKGLEKMFKEDEDFRKKTIELYGNLGNTSPNYSGVFGAYTPTKEASGLTTKETMGIKEGGMSGCPHRENGVKSDIKGISDIQVKGKKFVGVR